MTYRPVVSVIMAAYNAAPYVVEAVESIRAQTLTEWELLVREDGSADETRRILASFDDPRIRLLPERAHVGAARARNEALAEATGDYVAIQDADDTSRSDRLAKQTGFLAAHLDVSLVGSCATRVDAANVEIGLREPPLANEAIKRKGFDGACPFVHSSVLFRRHVLRVVTGYDARFAASEDYDFLLRVMERFKVVNLPEALCRYRYVPTGHTGADYVRQCAYRDLASTMSEARRDGRDPDAEGWPDASFRKIAAGEVPRSFRAEALRERARWLINHGFGREALRVALRALVAVPSRDGLWMLRQALKAFCFGRRGKRA
jgi:glycosyltransferase involved in cell wall biosynthesis